MSTRIPDTLHPATLRWLAKRDEASEIDLRKLANDRQLRIMRGEENADTSDHDTHVDRCRRLADDAASRQRWLRSAATRIERRAGVRR